MPTTLKRIRRPSTSTAARPAHPSFPRQLTHFTTLQGILGIIESGRLWASNVSFLNDRRELKHGLDASLLAIENLVNTDTFRRWRAILHEVSAKLKNGEISNTYALCLCEEADLLSQWRAYGGSVQGVSITFDQRPLSELMKQDKASLHKVIYTNLSTEKKIRDQIVSQLKQAENLSSLEDSLDSPAGIAAARKIVEGLLPQFKHLGFREEQEFRYVVQQRTIRDEVHFRAGPNSLIPYIELPRTAVPVLPIAEICVGPGRDQALTKESIELLLAKYGYDVPVVTSSVPYRT